MLGDECYYVLALDASYVAAARLFGRQEVKNHELLGRM
jgi:hypothetical protein